MDSPPLGVPNIFNLSSMSAPASPMVGYPTLSLAADSRSASPSSPASSSMSPDVSGPPAQRIRRPKNPFILFRCDFVKRGVVPASVERDHRNISRIAGRAWRLMTPAQKRPWEERAAVEKEEHARAHPGYKYKPSSRGGAAARSAAAGKRQARRARVEDGRCDQLARIVVGMRDGETLKDHVPAREHPSQNISRRRSSSCPPIPSASAVQPSSVSLQPSEPSFFAPRDDLFVPGWNLSLHSDTAPAWSIAPEETFQPGQLFSPFQYPAYDAGQYAMGSRARDCIPPPPLSAVDAMPAPLYLPAMATPNLRTLSSQTTTSQWHDQAVAYSDITTPTFGHVRDASSSHYISPLPLPPTSAATSAAHSSSPAFNLSIPANDLPHGMPPPYADVDPVFAYEAAADVAHLRSDWVDNLTYPVAFEEGDVCGSQLE